MTVVPALPADVAAAFDALPEAIRGHLLRMRALIFQVAQDTGTGPLTETLKWGEPAYLTQASKTGSTIRLGQVRGKGAAVLFNCNTSLVGNFREQFGDVFKFDGNRAVLLPEDWPEAALAICLGRALTYYRDRKGRG